MKRKLRQVIFHFLKLKQLTNQGNLFFNYLKFNTFQDAKQWEGEFVNALRPYEEVLINAFKQGQFENKDQKKTWSFFNAMFYCGTIYTTIGKFNCFFKLNH